MKFRTSPTNSTTTYSGRQECRSFDIVNPVLCILLGVVRSRSATCRAIERLAAFGKHGCQKGIAGQKEDEGQPEHDPYRCLGKPGKHRYEYGPGRHRWRRRSSLGVGRTIRHYSVWLRSTPRLTSRSPAVTIPSRVRLYRTPSLVASTV